MQRDVINKRNIKHLLRYILAMVPLSMGAYVLIKSISNDLPNDNEFDAMPSILRAIWIIGTAVDMLAAVIFLLVAAVWIFSDDF